MKFLKYLLFLILGLALIFFGAGLFTPSISYESEVSINKPIEEVWAVLSDETRVSEWLKEITKIELVSGTANTQGAVSKIYVVENGEELVMEETISALKPNEYMAMTFTMDFMNMDYEMLLSEREGRTHVLTKSKSTGNNFIARSILAFMTKLMQNQEDTNLNNLKKVVEENTKNYFPETNLESVGE